MYGVAQSRTWLTRLSSSMYECERWTKKKAECRRIDAFELWYWKRLLRVLWSVKKSNQSILKEICLEYSLEGLMLKLKLQYFGHLMWRADSLEKTLMLVKIEGRRWRGWQRMRWLDGSPTWWTWVWAISGSWWWTWKPGVLQSMGLQIVGHDLETKQQQVKYRLFPCKRLEPEVDIMDASQGSVDPWPMSYHPLATNHWISSLVSILISSSKKWVVRVLNIMNKFMA